MDPADLERWLDDELKELPAPQAPGTLMPRVLQAVQTAREDVAAPWSWRGWTPAQQLASAVGLVLVLAAVAGLWLVVRAPLAGALQAPVVEVAGRVEAINRHAYDITLAARVIWRVLEPFAIGVVALVAIMFGAVAAVGAALRSLVWGGTSA